MSLLYIFVDENTQDNVTKRNRVDFEFEATKEHFQKTKNEIGKRRHKGILNEKYDYMFYNINDRNVIAMKQTIFGLSIQYGTFSNGKYKVKCYLLNI